MSSQGVIAQQTTPPSVTELPAVNVSDADTGPHVWEFSNGPVRVLMLGTIDHARLSAGDPAPDVRNAIQQSGVVLGSPGVVIGEGIGILRGLSLWPSIRKSKYLPEGKQLADVVPPDLYASWRQIKSLYLGENADVERMMPMYGAWKLHEAMLTKRGLRGGNQGRSLIAELAQKHSIDMLDARFHLVIKDPKRAVQQFQVPQQQDVECLRSTLASMQTSPLAFDELSDAWSRGDVAKMTATLASNRFPDFCWVALTDQAIARQQGVLLDSEMRDAWVAALRKGMATSNTIFMTAPVSDLLNQTGRIAWLTGEGFRPALTSPDEQPD